MGSVCAGGAHISSAVHRQRWTHVDEDVTVHALDTSSVNNDKADSAAVAFILLFVWQAATIWRCETPAGSGSRARAGLLGPDKERQMAGAGKWPQPAPEAH
jgi:hypothetical protein